MFVSAVTCLFSFSLIQTAFNLYYEKLQLVMKQNLAKFLNFQKVFVGNIDFYKIDSRIVFDLSPLLIWPAIPKAIAVSSIDSEYSGISLLFSVPFLAQIVSTSRAKAGYDVRIEKIYRLILIYLAILTLYFGDGLNFLRSEMSELHLKSEVSHIRELFSINLFKFIGWRMCTTIILACFPVYYFSNRLITSLLGHFVKVIIILPILLVRRKNILLRCEDQSYSCANLTISKWMWSKESNRIFFTLIMLSTLASDLSWYDDKQNQDITTSNEVEMQIV